MCMGLVDFSVLGTMLNWREVGENVSCYPQVVYSPPGQAGCETGGDQQGAHYAMQTAQAIVQKSAMQVQERNKATLN